MLAFSEITKFPALFLGPDGKAIVFVTIFPSEDNEVYYGTVGAELVPLEILSSDWHDNDNNRERLVFRGLLGPWSRIELWRSLAENFVTIDDEHYEYISNPDPSLFAFRDMPDGYRQLIDETWRANQLADN
jgi:hypothetical protein